MSNQTNYDEKTAAKPVGNLMNVLSYTAEKTMELADANSVIGDKIEADGMTIIPISRISVGFAGGGSNISNAAKKSSHAPAGAGAKVDIIPLTFLVIDGENTRLINIADQSENSSVSQILNTVMDTVKSLRK